MRKIFGDTIKVFLSNFIQILSGILIGFVIPKIMGITDYGYYKIFTLYTAYTGLCQFGFLDGLTIKFGGCNLEQINKEEFSLYFRFFVLLQILCGIVLLTVATLILPNDYRIIVVLLSVYMVIMNTTAFFQMLSKITLRFNELALRNVLQAIMISCAVLVLQVLFKVNDIEVKYYTYIWVLLTIYFLLMVWYFVTYREVISISNAKTVRRTLDANFQYIRAGFPVMVAYLCSTLILTLDRQFVSVLFDTPTYAIYAFAYTILALVTTALSALATVIYPNLKRLDEKNLIEKYPKLITLFFIFAFGSLVFYYPLIAFVKWYLPQYSDSIVIFRIVLPSVVVSAAITIVMQNYYVALNEGRQFFKKTVIALMLALITNSIAYIAFKSTLAISMASVIVSLIWYTISDSFFVKNFQIKWKKNCFYMVLIILVFYLCTEIKNTIVGIVGYLFAYFIISALMYKNFFYSLICKLKNR
ncbi:Membrane protein involved in the export of O-antigen and teichoic acid [Lachnospiraceae bacterium C10]|nr:Membrane protein involved in the export of O-antigen and teichoic acid [Lachnospiraceae bacterium C10]